MYEIELLDLKTNKTFKKTFWSPYLKDKFVRKCKHSNELKILCIIDNSRFYD